MNEFTIKAQGTFSELYAAVEQGQGDAGVKGGKALYETGRGPFDTRKLSAKRLTFGGLGGHTAKRIADAIDKEYGKGAAEPVFKKVLGRDTFSASKVTLDNLRALKNELSYQRKKSDYRGRGLASTKFSTIARTVAAFKNDKGDIKDKFKRTKHLRFTSEKNIYFHKNWSTGFKAMLDLQASREDKRDAAGAAIWKAIANEYGGKAADLIFTRVFGDRVLRESGDQHKIAVTIAQFEAIEAQIAKLDAVSKKLHKYMPAPLDVMTALFGPRGNDDKAGNTKATFQRLENVLPDDAVQALDDRPPLLVAYMSHPDRVRSLLDRSVGKSITNQVWNEVLDPDRPADQKLEAQDILDLCTTAHIRAAYSLVPADPSQGLPSKSDIPPELDNSSKLDVPLKPDKLPKSDVLPKPDNSSKSDLPQEPNSSSNLDIPPKSSKQVASVWPGIRYDADDSVLAQYIVLCPGVSEQDARAYDDLKQIEAIVTAAEQDRLGSDLLRKRGKKGSLKPNQAAMDLFTRRVNEIHTRFRKRLEENVKAQWYNNELRRMFQKKVSSNPQQRPAMGRKRGRDPANLLRAWVAKDAELQNLDRQIKIREASRKGSAGSALISKRTDLRIDVASARHAYQTHPWTERMVEDYGHLGFRSNRNYINWNESELVEVPLRKDTVAAFDAAANLAKKLAERLEDLPPKPGDKQNVGNELPSYDLERKDWAGHIHPAVHPSRR